MHVCWCIFLSKLDMSVCLRWSYNIICFKVWKSKWRCCFNVEYHYFIDYTTWKRTNNIGSHPQSSRHNSNNICVWCCIVLQHSASLLYWKNGSRRREEGVSERERVQSWFCIFLFPVLRDGISAGLVFSIYCLPEGKTSVTWKHYRIHTIPCTLMLMDSVWMQTYTEIASLTLVPL